MWYIYFFYVYSCCCIYCLTCLTHVPFIKNVIRVRLSTLKHSIKLEATTYCVRWVSASQKKISSRLLVMYDKQLPRDLGEYTFFCSTPWWSSLFNPASNCLRVIAASHKTDNFRDQGFLHNWWDIFPTSDQSPPTQLPIMCPLSFQHLASKQVNDLYGA